MERYEWGDDPERRRWEERERERRREHESWRVGPREREERWPRQEERWSGREERWPDERWTGRDPERGSGREERWPQQGRWSEREERWSGREGERHARPEIDPPWIERGPDARRRGDTRGLVEWEDRGPLEWLGSKFREATGRGRGRGPKGWQRSDERIREEVCERIARSGIDADEVEVTVENREVTLTGTVRERREKWWLEDLADDVFGVEDVHNRLHVRRMGEEDRAGGSAPEPTQPH